MRELDQLIVIIPVVLNLNGNIEMNLSARLGTAANVGELDDPAVRHSMITGNLGLLQVQTISVSFIAACISLLLGLTLPRHTTKVGNNPPVKDVQRRKLLNLLNPRRTVPRPSGYGSHKLDLHTFVAIHSISQTLSQFWSRFVMVAGSAMSAASLSGFLLGSLMCALTILCRIFGLDPGKRIFHSI